MRMSGSLVMELHLATSDSDDDVGVDDDGDGDDDDDGPTLTVSLTASCRIRRTLLDPHIHIIRQQTETHHLGLKKTHSASGSSTNTVDPLSPLLYTTGTLPMADWHCGALFIE